MKSLPRVLASALSPSRNETKQTGLFFTGRLRDAALAAKITQPELVEVSSEKIMSLVLSRFPVASSSPCENWTVLSRSAISSMATRASA